MDVLEKVEVEYATLAGWKTSTKECRTFESLPENARNYLRFIEEFLQVPSWNIYLFIHLNEYKKVIIYLLLS